MPEPGTMPIGNADDSSLALLKLALPQSVKVVLVLDLVESVRIMNSDEAGTVARWRDFVRGAQTQTIPNYRGRLVKSLGDGLMVEFDEARDAVRAAFEFHKLMDLSNTGLSGNLQMRLRIGINSSHVFTDDLDIYGAGVNLAARLTTLAGPGETVTSAGVRDALAEGLDAAVEDLGQCYLKHIDQPVHAYRIGEAGAAPVVPPRRTFEAPLQPTVAVIPLDVRSGEATDVVLGDLIADGVIAKLSRTASLKLISRLTTAAFRSRNASPTDLRHYLGADYVLSGNCVVRGNRIVVSVELSDTLAESVVWADRMEGNIGDLFAMDAELPNQIAVAAHASLLQQETKSATTAPLPTLKSYSLFLGAIQLMHRSSVREFDRSREALDYLVERHRNSAAARAWRANWSILRMTRGLSPDPVREAAEALDQTARALDAEPGNVIALAVEGFVYCHLKRDLEKAYERVDAALALDPSCSLAWLFMATIQSLRGKSGHAVTCGERAIALSPMDPLKYYYQCLTGSAMLFDGQLERARVLLNASWTLNRSHAPTVRMLVVANSELDDMVKAREFLAQLRVIEPNLTVATYLARSPGAPEMRRRFADAMSLAGLPS